MAAAISREEVQAIMTREAYVCDRSLVLAVFLALNLEKPLFLEGEAGVGKTEVAKVLARGLGARLIRLQCHEGLEANSALYEWNYPKQLLALKSAEIRHDGRAPDIFTEEFLIRRPLLAALDGENGPVVLLIDEIDRADEEFEAFLLEVLSDFTISIPELGTVTASQPPVVVLTSNRTREIHDALKRRCLYHWIDYPSPEKELAIVAARLPEVPEKLAREICAFMAKIRTMDFLKKPGAAETLDWARALLLLGGDALDAQAVRDSMGCILKYEEDLRRLGDPAVLRALGCGAGPA
ncbi:MAG: MoxR family ATPase [Pseudomonadota bacterium]